jgi:O-antigen/teichoic acid export membrane protein
MSMRIGHISRNALSYVSGQVAMAVAGLLSSAILARYMTKAAFGDYSYLVALATLVIPLLDLGGQSIAMIQGARDRGRMGWYWARTVGIKLYSTPLTAAVLAAYFWWGEGSVGVRFVLVLIYAWLQALLLSTDAPFRASERGKLWAIRRTVYEIAFLLMTVAALAFFHLTGALQQVTVGILSIALGVGWAMVTVFRITNLSWHDVADAVFRPFPFKELKALWPFALSAVLFAFYYRLTVVFIEKLGNTSEVADFRVAFIVMMSALYVTSAVIWSTVPRIALHDEQGNTEQFHKLLRHSSDINFYLSVLITVGGYLYGGKLIAIVFGPKYAAMTGLWHVMDLALGIFFLQQYYSTLLNSLRHERSVSLTLALGIVLLTILNIVLIPKMGAIGAAWARVAAGVLMVPLNMRRVAAIAGWHTLFGRKPLLLVGAGAISVAIGAITLPVQFWLSIALFLASFALLTYLSGSMPHHLERIVTAGARLVLKPLTGRGN